MIKDIINELNNSFYGFTNNKPSLMAKYIQRKLDRSLDNYLQEVELNINYLLNRDPEKVQRWVEKKINKGEI